MFSHWLKMTEFQCCFSGAAIDINILRRFSLPEKYPQLRWDES
ncbi:hypothetical protein SAMN04488689_1067 [Paenibacillus sp. cl6col]|nr:hypothetical protein PBN151_2805 [Paenibacillus sp. NAIST15-1]SDF62770.1 hypothetical protein SAMN04488689_1067 [Paenibacillus sp. cl6col]